VLRRVLCFAKAITEEQHMITPEQARQRLKDSVLTRVSIASGISYFTLRRFVVGEVKDPSYSTMKKLDDYFKSVEAGQ
jgi:hypothetical protein